MNAWNQLDTRQKRLVSLAGLVLVAALVYVWVWEPLAEARATERERIAQQQALLNWLEAVGPMAERLRESGRGGREASDRSLLGLADETARAAGLAGAMARIEPAGDGEVRVWLEGADFVTVMGWLEDFSRSRPVQVSQLQVDRAGTEDGQVNVRVTLVSNA
jgi:general secretion pathway protein M